MNEQQKWQEAAAAWSECKRGLLSKNDFWSIVHDLASK